MLLSEFKITERCLTPDIAQSQQALVGRVVPVNLPSEEGTPSDMPSVLGDNPLWQEFWEWRQQKDWLTNW
jgi:hypothetical protein